MTINGQDPRKSQDPIERLDDEVTGLTRHISAYLRVQGRMDARQDRMDVRQDRMESDISELKTDVSVLKTDVSVLKADVAGLKTQVNSLERSTKRRFNRVDAQLERLIMLVQRAATR